MNVTVPPKSTADLLMAGRAVRKELGLGDFDNVDLRDIISGYIGYQRISLVNEKESGVLAKAHPNIPRLEIQRRVWDGGDSGLQKFTLAHEFFHLVLHGNLETDVFYRYADPSMRRNATIPLYRDSEWQADIAAAELIAPLKAVMLCKSPREVAERFGLSMQAATIQFDKSRNKKGKQ